MIWLVGPALGFASYSVAVPRQKDNESKAVWAELLFLAAGAFVLSMLVLRAISISYLYMLPGNAWLLWKAMCKARTLERAWLRIIASVATIRSEEHTSELQSLMRTSYAVFCLKKTIQQ